MVNLSIKRISGFFFLFSIATTLSIFSAARKPQVTIKTVPEAIHALNMMINTAPYLDSANVPAYEKENAPTMIACAKVLYDNARGQILDALSEIDNRIAYWQYQKDHPWNYFVSKNPLKWVTGPKQEDEVENNLDTLKSHQGELYVLLGQLSELGVAFTQGYKDTFLTDYHKGYEWIDALLNALVRLTTKASTSDIPFVARAQQLQWKLERVHQFKNDLISDISETEIPSFITRNWLKGGAALFGLNYGYQNYSTQMMNALTVGQQKGQEYLIKPGVDLLKDLLTPGWQRKSLLTIEDKKEPLSNEEKSKILPDLAKNYEAKLGIVKQYVLDMGEKYGLQEEAKDVLTNFENKNYEPFVTFLENIKMTPAISKKWSFNPLTKIREVVAKNWEDYLTGTFFSRELEGMRYGMEAEEYFLQEKEKYEKYALVEKKKYEEYALEQQKKYEDQYAGVGKIVLLIPAFLAASGVYLAYQKLTAKNYGPLRRALVDINYLFIDPSKPLNDEQYGKMIYLVHMLKKRAEKELPLKRNMRADFIADLEKIESPELSVSSKRAVIEDMFKKYSFLGLIQTK